MIKTWLFAILKYVAPIFLLAIPAMIIYGFISPWYVSKEALSKYENNLVLLIGFRNESGSVGGKPFDRKSRTYLIIDDDLQSKTLTVFAEFDKFNKIEEENGGLLMFVVWYLILTVITGYFWLKPNNRPTASDARNRAVE